MSTRLPLDRQRLAKVCRSYMVGLHQLEEELSGVFGGHRVDLVNPRYLNRRIRDSVLDEAEVQFAEV